MAKTLCKLKDKQLSKEIETLQGNPSVALHICRKCARASHHRERLCKPSRYQPATAEAL